MRAPITLTQEKLEEITGYSRTSAQARWLMEAYQIQAKYKAGGGLSVPRLLYFQRAGISIDTAEPNEQPTMNWAALEKEEARPKPNLDFLETEGKAK
ncbi:DUF4224 domain-containing protein [Alcanivorax sp.]|uniref:DUF4224 domain-containing protein n=1 Tax=Alcanivorax sp. TaxID=1872427 RepID=UPI0025C620B3|nr:DUF4224 domain-containing protein [Alcanivorax sp.]